MNTHFVVSDAKFNVVLQGDYQTCSQFMAEQAKAGVRGLVMRTAAGQIEQAQIKTRSNATQRVLVAQAEARFVYDRARIQKSVDYLLKNEDLLTPAMRRALDGWQKGQAQTERELRLLEAAPEAIRQAKSKVTRVAHQLA